MSRFICHFMSLVTALFIALSLHSCSDNESQDSKSEKENAIYREMFGLFTKSGRFAELVDFATPIFYAHRSDSSSVIAADACAYIAQSYIYMEKYDSTALYADYLEVYKPLKTNDIQWNYIVNNMSALWAIKMKGDYDGALSFYLKSLDDVDSAGEKRTKIVVLSNIVSLYRSLKNPDGLPYAEMAYKLGSSIGDDYYLASGAYSLASMLYINGKFADAEKYVSLAIGIAKSRNMDYILAESYLVYGDICAARFDYENAGQYYRYAMKYATEEMSGLYVKTCLSYGKMYNLMKEYDKSLQYLKEGLKCSDETGEKECYVQLLKAIAVSYRHLEMSDSAEVYNERYRRLENHERYISNEQGFDKVLMQYYQEEISNRNARLEKARTNNLILVFVVVLVIMLLVFIFILYRNRNRNYSALLEQYNRLTSNHNGNIQEEGADSEKEKMLWEKVSTLMQEEHLYKSKDVSLAKISEILGTNRTYISRVINKYSGLSFYDYINRYRIRKAMEILSDPNNDTPLKVLWDDLGYNSNSVFYRAFMKETGVPPSYFKEDAQKKNRQM